MFSGFMIGDRVRLRRDVGLLKAGAVGLVVEEYEELPARHHSPEVATQGALDVAVVWPSLRHDHTPENGAWHPKGIDGSNLLEGDVVPMSSGELDFVDNLLAVIE